jgi:hypothetical protein
MDGSGTALSKNSILKQGNSYFNGGHQNTLVSKRLIEVEKVMETPMKILGISFTSIVSIRIIKGISSSQAVIITRSRILTAALAI